MAKTKKERLEMLRKQLFIRKSIVEANGRFCREIKAEIEALEHGS